MHILSSFDFGTAWRVAALNLTGGTQTVTSIAKCLNVQPASAFSTAKKRMHGAKVRRR
jgi:AraC-like DNA-binding protein